MITEAQHAQIVQYFGTILNEKLTGLLPDQLTSVKPTEWTIYYTFKPFTGREPEPKAPDYRELPRLAFKHMDEEAGRPVAGDAEYQLRRSAGRLLDDIYTEARRHWRNAAYVLALKDEIRDAPALWADYQQESAALEAAYTHLRSPEAGAEWRSAVSRLLDAQDRALAAAEAFDRRGRKIARVNAKFLYADIVWCEAVEQAGHPEGRDWYLPYVEEHHVYNLLAEKVSETNRGQRAHVAQVGRLAGEHADA